MIIGASALTIVLLAVLTLGSYLHHDPMWWSTPGLVFIIGIICFVFRLYNWCNIKHLFIPSAIILGIYFLLIRNGHYMPEWSETGVTYFALILLFYMIIAPGIIGMFVANLTCRYVQSTRARTIILVTIIILIASIFLPKFISDQYILRQSKKHSMIMGPPDLNVNAEDLKNTEVFASFNHPISKGTNLIWCATMQMAWDELCGLIGEDILFDTSNMVAEALNKKRVAPHDLDDETYIAIAGVNGIKTIQKIDEALRAKFGDAATPELLSDSVNDLIAYSYFFVNLPFEWTFERRKTPFVFQGKKIKSFGINEYEQGDLEEIRAAGQILVYDAQGEDDFIVELKTRKTNHHLILAKVPPESTLVQTITSVQQRIAVAKSDELGVKKSFIVPILNFKILKEYQELTGKALKVKNKQYSGRNLKIVQQLIRFKLNERGAVLKSEAGIAFCDSEKPNLVFDKPFLIMLKYEEAKNPYFAIWVDNPEILVKF